VQAGIMITGSNSPSEFNGFKIFLNKKLVQGSELAQIYEILKQGQFAKLAESGKITPCPILDQYVDNLWQEFAHLSEYDFSMMVDCGNGATGPVMKKLIHRMGWKQVQLLCEQVDGNFSIHTPDPSDIKNMTYLKLELKKTKKQFGVAFDGDGDSMLAMDYQGKMVFGDRLAAMFAQDILIKHAHRMIVSDIPSEKLTRLIANAHGQSLIIGSCLKMLSDAFISQHAIFAAQMTGKFFFKDRHVGCYSDGIYSMLRMLDLLVKNRTTFTQMLQRVDQQLESVVIKNDISETIKEF
jgi:phosphomannomutase